MNDHHYTLGMLFTETVNHHPSLIALHYDDKPSVSYGVLNARANQLCHYLKDHEITRGSVVALFHDKSPTAYAIMLACLKLGAIYVNLDPASPVDRLDKTISTCQPLLLFIGNLKPEKGKYLTDYPLCYFDSADGMQSINKFPSTNLVNHYQITRDDPAYLMFTSGSTGFPKGVAIPHVAVINFIAWCRDRFSISTGDILAGVNPSFFDNSVFDFYAALFSGGGLAPIPDSVVKRPMQLVNLLYKLRCSIWFSVPSMFIYVIKMRALTATSLPELRLVAFGGEGFPKTPLRQLYSLLGDRVDFINVYGPSECTCICSSYQIKPDDLRSSELLPLGHIADNFSFCILDENGVVVENGDVGELCLMGPQVGLGYYNNKTQTEIAFKCNLSESHFAVRAYHSGDLVRYDAKKSLLWFSGRKDNQIKRMGYRIELEEIEAALGSLPCVNEAICIYIQSEKLVAGELVAWVSPVTNEQQVLEGLKALLPTYMLPSIIRMSAALPKNQNGKIDRKSIFQEEKEALS